MAAFAVDTSSMVPTLLGEHQHRVRAIAAINERLDRGDAMLIVAHTLVETYSVLTRLPSPAHVAPTEAYLAIERTFISRGTVVALESGEYVELVRGLSSDSVPGGRVYDALIVACARARGATEILTFNERHFRPFEGNGLSIVVP